MRVFWRVGPDAWHGALASSTHSTATTVTSSKPPRKKYRPSRALHRLAHVFSERKIAPAHSKLAKNGTFTHAGAKNISQNPTAPHAGAVFLSLLPLPNPTSATKFALLASISAHARKSSPSTHKTPQNRPFFACWANFFAPMGQQPPHDTCRPPCLKLMTPMLVDYCHEMKPPAPLRAPSRTRLKPLTPLLAQNSQIQAVFRPQRCHGFHAPLAEHPQRHRRFHGPLAEHPQRRPRFHPRRTLRPQPKPCAACAHAITPVAHWPHD